MQRAKPDINGTVSLMPGIIENHQKQTKSKNTEDMRESRPQGGYRPGVKVSSPRETVVVLGLLMDG